MRVSTAAAVEGVPALPPRVLIIAPHGSYRTFAYQHAAQRLGARAVIASEGKHSIISIYAEGLHVDFNDLPAALQIILEESARAPFAAVIGTDDGTTEIAARIASQLGLPHNRPSAVLTARRKDLAREALAHSNVPKPQHWIIELDQPLLPQVASVLYPVVVKPVALSASRGVIRANDLPQLTAAMERISRLLHTVPELEPSARQRLVIEQFVPGQEVTLEGMLRQGELTVLAVFDKPDPLDGPYFEETYYITPSRLPEEVQHALISVVTQACGAYGLSEGPIHAECRIHHGGVFVLEVAARTIGGLCGKLLRFGTGYSLEELVISHAMGKTLSVQSETGAAGVLMIPIPQAGMLKRIEGILAAQRVPYIEDIDIQIREGHELVPLPEGASYLGFIFARAPTPAQAEQALRDAHACLRFVIAPVWKLEPKVIT
ncbi:MAG: ATP-grasp domain-containing protein [Gammaproteobacteria bacterium]|nr:ATP-grasp domain-containing protein [Gammaproteobacteria bacterium]